MSLTDNKYKISGEQFPAAHGLTQASFLLCCKSDKEPKKILSQVKVAVDVKVGAVAQLHVHYIRT